ncbi:MAG: hypothetical protein IT347_10710 [Candidatus Eisenbacteria bacterium]|nr:hypothetical protein [Candidatus Eisenbacteria bacterium]
MKPSGPLRPLAALVLMFVALAPGPAFAQTDPRPSPRDNHTAIYDPVRDRMIVFGGWNGVTNFGDAWALSLSGTPTWTPLSPAGTPPAGRRWHSAVYDSLRDRMLVFGGFTGDLYVNDVWALSLAGTPEWTELTPTGTPPSPRYRQSAIYDPVRDRLVIFGGWFSGDGYNDVWALSLAGTPQWQELTPAGPLPSPRISHSAIFDPIRDRMLVFGGVDDSLLNETWALSMDNPAWTELSPAGERPLPRYIHSAVYDPVRDRMVIYGGYDVALYGEDAWALSLADSGSWSELAPAGSLPPGRQGHGAIYDPLRDRMVVFGGFGAPGFLDDTWSLSLGDPTAWTPMFPSALLTLTVNAEHGTVTEDPLPAGGGFAYGTAVHLTAVPDAGYHFVDFSGAIAATTDTATVVLVSDETVTASFAPTLAVDGNALPAATLLQPARPNPFHGTATLDFSLVRGGPVDLSVFAVDGRHVRTLDHEALAAGEYRERWDGRDDDGNPLASGVYYARLETEDGPLTRIITYLR